MISVVLNLDPEDNEDQLSNWIIGRPISDETLQSSIMAQAIAIGQTHSLSLADTDAIYNAGLEMGRWVLNPTQPIQPYRPMTMLTLSLSTGEDLEIMISPSKNGHARYCNGCHCHDMVP